MWTNNEHCDPGGGGINVARGNTMAVSVPPYQMSAFLRRSELPMTLSEDRACKA